MLGELLRADPGVHDPGVCKPGRFPVDHARLLRRPSPARGDHFCRRDRRIEHTTRDDVAQAAAGRPDVCAARRGGWQPDRDLLRAGGDWHEPTRRPFQYRSIFDGLLQLHRGSHELL